MLDFKDKTCSFCTSSNLELSEASIRDKNTLEIKENTFQLICKTCGRSTVVESITIPPTV